MAVSELSTHIHGRKMPKFFFTTYNAPPSFITIGVVLEGHPIVTFFVEKPIDVVNFKNNLLWAFEKFMREQAS